MKFLPLFEEYPQLQGHIPWISLGDFPTPVRRLKMLGEQVGVNEFYVKEDDRSSKIYGGNKVRKLEFLLGEALERKADTVITVGAVGSNHALATAIFAKQLGIKTIAVLIDQPVAAYVKRNLLLDLYFDAKLVYSPSMYTAPFTVAFKYITSSLQGWPYYMPLGGSNRLGCLGFVNAGFELKRQVEAGILPEPDYLFAAAGTLGTVAGLCLGCKLSGLRTKVVGVRVAGRKMCNAQKWAGLVNSASELLCTVDSKIPRVKISAGDVLLLNDYVGKGYARFTEQGVEAFSLMKRLEGITLDGTYTGKALAGALEYMDKYGLEDEVVLFWNTYNSVSLSHLAEKVHRKHLPRSFQKYFERPVQTLDPES